MVRQVTTQLQISARRFTARRMERALLAAGAPGPGARSAMSAGCLLAVLAMIGFAVLALVRPQPDLAGAPVVMGRRTGALYAWVGETLHPVLNLASARLIAGSAADPLPVLETDIARAPRGPLLGIPGAPQLVGPARTDPETWSVCDSAGTAGRSAPATAVVVGEALAKAGRVGDGQSVLVDSGPGTPAYLLRRGRRVLTNPAGFTPRRVSDLLLNAIPEGPPGAEDPELLVAPAENATTLCVSWGRLADGRADISILVGSGLPVPPGGAPVPLSQADGAGPALDAVYLPPGRSVYARTTGIADQPNGARYLITDTGVRFAVVDDDAARSLGLPAEPAPAPWPVLAGLPAGPDLSRQQALVAWDAVGADRAAAAHLRRP